MGQRLRATTIQGRRCDGPQVEEWDEVDYLPADLADLLYERKYDK